jgi:hypothetical protein
VGQMQVSHSPTVFLHVGAPKTGTTFLQRVLWKNQAALEERGVWLPGTDWNHHFRAGFDLLGFEQDPDDPRERWKGAWNAMASEIREATAETVVVSDERLAACTTDEIARAVKSLSPREVHVIYTLRDLASLLPAEWQEHVKHGDIRTFDQWFADEIVESNTWFWRLHDGSDVLHRWGSAVPTERLHVLTLPRLGSRPGLLWERFASVLEIEQDDIDIEVPVNATLGAEGAELLRRVNQSNPRGLLPWHQVEVKREIFAHRVLAMRQQKDPITLPSKWFDWVTDYSERLVKHLRSVGYPVAGDLDELMPGVTETAAGRGREPDIALIAVESIAGLLIQMSSMWDERQMLRGKLSQANAERAVAEARARRTEAALAERERSPASVIRHMVVSLGRHWPVIDALLRVWRRIKAMVKQSGSG